MLKSLKEAVYEANMELPKRHLVTYTWGNVSGISREKGLVVIKPSGVEYDELSPDKLAAVDWAGYVHNLVPVTIGNMVGGILFVAVFYYLVFKHNLEKMD